MSANKEIQIMPHAVVSEISEKSSTKLQLFLYVLCRIAVIMLVVSGAVLSVSQTYNYTVNYPVVLFFSFLCMLIFGMTFFNSRMIRVFRIIMILFVIFSFFLLRERIAEGAEVLRKNWLYLFDIYYGLPEKSLIYGDVTGNTAAMCCIMFFVCISIYFGVIRKFNHWYILIIILMQCIASLICGIFPPLIPMSLQVIAWFSVYAGTTNVSSGKITKKNAVLVPLHKEGGVFSQTSQKICAVVLIAGLILMSLMSLIVPVLDTKWEERSRIRIGVQNGEYMQSFEKWVDNAPILGTISQFFYSTKKAGVSGGRIGDEDEITFLNQTDLKVTYTLPQYSRVYLKGFTGRFFTGNQWVNDEGDTGSKETLDSLNFPFAFARSHGVGQQNKVTVKVENADSGYRYIPYYSVCGETLGRMGDDGYLLSPLSGDNRSYEVDYTSLDYATLFVLNTGEFNEDLEYRSRAYNYYLQLPESGQERSLRLLQDYFYGKETAKTYDLRGTLNDTFKNDISKVSLLDKAILIQKILSSETEYTLKPGRSDKSMDFVEEFLIEKKKGYCTYFATAGTVLFRMCGVPARYVEGYLCEPAEAGAEVDIENRNAHAWTEVYLDGFGWIPVEVTKGYFSDQDLYNLKNLLAGINPDSGDNLNIPENELPQITPSLPKNNQADDSIKPPESNIKPEVNNTPQENLKDKDKKDRTDNNPDNNINSPVLPKVPDVKKKLSPVLKVLIIIILAVCSVVLGCFINRFIKRRRFYGNDFKKSIYYLYSDGNHIAKRYSVDSDAKEALYSVAKEMRFSNHPVTSDMRQRAVLYRNSLVEQARNGKNLFVKKVIDILYAV